MLDEKDGYVEGNFYAFTVVGVSSNFFHNFSGLSSNSMFLTKEKKKKKRMEICDFSQKSYLILGNGKKFFRWQEKFVLFATIFCLSPILRHFYFILFFHWKEQKWKTGYIYWIFLSLFAFDCTKKKFAINWKKVFCQI